MSEAYKKEGQLYLEGITIHILRNIARIIGVAQATTRSKNNLVNNIIEILTSDHEANSKYFRNRVVKMGSRVREDCESILDQLIFILHIEDSLICKVIKSQYKLIVPSQKTQVSFNALHSFNRYISGILSLCEGDNELEVIAKFLDYQWQIRNIEHKRSI